MAFGGHELAMLQTDALQVSGNPMRALMILVGSQQDQCNGNLPIWGS
jgi:hypothetical protein